jgi:hypothetical protein
MRNWIKKNHILIILFCIVWYCTFLLFYKLWLQSFWIDEWFGTYEAKSIVLHWLYKSKYFLFEWLQAIFLKIWWFTDFWARVPSVLSHIWSIILIYYITYKLTKNKYAWLISTLVFWLLYRELGWWRDARFYSLLQLVFLLWLVLIIKWDETDNIRYMNAFIMLSGIWAVFHPFLYVFLVIWVLMFLSKYKKTWNFKTLFSRKYLSMWILIWTLLILAMILWSMLKLLSWWNILSWSLLWDKPTTFIRYYFNSYSSHLWEQLWITCILWVLWMLWVIIKAFAKKNTRDFIILSCPFLIFIYAIVIKWYLLHYRYAFLLFPVIILLASIFVFDITTMIKNKYINIAIVIWILLGIWFTAKLQYYPIAYYYFDYTSPQPDFKTAYSLIPDNQSVISWFPVLCDWYYSDRWDCVYAIRVDLRHDWKTEKLLKTSIESYTKIPYIDNTNLLWKWTYYFVMDNLTSKSNNINRTLYDKIYQYATKIFDEWDSYNNIKVFKFDVK